jgi:alkylation response protein AidB-like acyl-CoA dehydrogenase
MNLTLSREDADFLAEVEQVLEPFGDTNGFIVSNTTPALKAFYKALAERNWLALSWPVSAGGLGRSPLQEFLLWNEAHHRNIARPPQGVGVVAKTIIRHGTDAQKEQWLGSIRRHEATFALAYSEPNAGSDLGSLQCKAVLSGDRYVLNGNKCWNSKAHTVDYLWLLCRTGEASAGKKGLTILIVDAHAPGVVIRPLKLMCGNMVTEIFFENAEVPVTHRIGPENGAWRLITEALADERYVHFTPGRVRHDYFKLRGWLEAHGKLGDPAARRRFDELAVQVLQAEAHVLRLLTNEGDASGIAASNKLAHVNAIQAIARAAIELGGIEAMVLDEPTSLHWRQTMTESIGGGTTEIMESIVARQRLGLAANR